jgi:hypothetical protein
MKPRQLNIHFVWFAYGGNGGLPSMHPDTTKWLLDTILDIKAARKDEQIDEVTYANVSETPITMSRNFSVEQAKSLGADVLVMIDSDMAPDFHKERPGYQPFFQSSFDFLYKHYDEGPVIVGAPYCGPPPARNVYVFKHGNFDNDHTDDHFKLEAYTRSEAEKMGGIQDCAALPTGLIMYDMRIWDVVEPPYFYYEYQGDGLKCPHCHQPKPSFQAQKASTEDVTATRDICFNGELELGYNPVFCNWDAWAGHIKQEKVGAPILMKADQISQKLRKAIQRDVNSNDKLVIIGDRKDPKRRNSQPAR